MTLIYQVSEAKARLIKQVEDIIGAPLTFDAIPAKCEENIVNMFGPRDLQDLGKHLGSMFAKRFCGEKSPEQKKIILDDTAPPGNRLWYTLCSLKDVDLEELSESDDGDEVLALQWISFIIASFAYVSDEQFRWDTGTQEKISSEFCQIIEDGVVALLVDTSKDDVVCRFMGGSDGRGHVPAGIGNFDTETKELTKVLTRFVDGILTPAEARMVMKRALEVPLQGRSFTAFFVVAPRRTVSGRVIYELNVCVSMRQTLPHRRWESGRVWREAGDLGPVVIVEERDAFHLHDLNMLERDGQLKLKSLLGADVVSFASDFNRPEGLSLDLFSRGLQLDDKEKDEPNADRIAQLESENASLRSSNAYLRRSNRSLGAKVLKQAADIRVLRQKVSDNS